jgi:hypothetical protein
MAQALLCRLPHKPNGLPEGWSVGRLIDIDRLSYLRRRQLTDAQRRIFDDLSAEAARTGICPNHLRILLSIVTRAFI